MIYYFTSLLKQLIPNVSLSIGRRNPGLDGMSISKQAAPRRRGGLHVDYPVSRCLLAFALMAAGFAGSIASAQATTGYKLVTQFSTTEGHATRAIAANQATNNVYVASLFPFGHGFVEEFSSSGVLLRQLELPSAALPQRFSGVAVDQSNQNAYVYDNENETIDAFESSGKPVGAFEGGASPTLSVTGGREAEAQIATDSSGDIYYPNQALGEIQEFQSNGAPGGVTITGLYGPTDVAVTSTRVYVTDKNTSTGNSQVEQFNSSGAPLSTETLGAGVLSDPKAIAVDSSGDVFVVDENNEGVSSVDEFNPTETLVRTFGVGLISRVAGIAVNYASEEVYIIESSGYSSSGVVWVFGPSSITTPTAESGPAVDVESSSATLTGTVNPGGSGGTTYAFEYGMSTAYEQSTAGVDAGSGTANVAVQAAISFLAPNQRYHYRVVATTKEGDRVYGADQEFTTEAQGPSVIGERASGVAETDAELEARINPNNEPTTYYFKFVSQADYETSGFADATEVPSSPGLEVGANYEEYYERQDIGGGLLPNTTYYFEAIATNATSTTESPVEHFTTLAPPLAQTEVPTLITDTTATLAGTVTTYDRPTSYWFEYVSQADYEVNGFTNAAIIPQPEGSLEANTQPVPVTTVVGELTPGTTYHVRLDVDNEDGFREGSEVVFTTVVLPPAVSTGLVVSSAPTEVEVNGGVNPEHGDTKYHFEYIDGQDFARSGYQNAISLPQPDGDAGEGGESQIVTAMFTGLAPATGYHYRVVATNAGGTHKGTDKTFTTPAEWNASGTADTTSSPFGTGAGAPLSGLIYPDLAGLTPVSARKQVTAPKPRALSCRAKAKKIKEGKRRKAALKGCGKVKRKAGNGRGD